MNYDSYFDPPEEKWGRCPSCGCSQEDAERVNDPDVYLCECGRWYTDEAANPDPREMRAEARMSEAGL